jgi:DNA-directed RNA polymerase specialized sigma24 family protein
MSMQCLSAQDARTHHGHVESRLNETPPNFSPDSVNPPPAVPSAPMPPVDHFPSTHATWIDAQLTLAEGADPRAATSAAQSLRTHVMERYHRPLCAYVHTGVFARLGEPEDLVAGFFAKHLQSLEFMMRWRTSGMPLRRWMMNAASFHCRGLARDRARAPGREMLDPAGADGLLDALPSAEPAAERAFDRAWAVTLANEAHVIAQTDADDRGRPDDYVVFRMHVMDRMEYDAIAAALGITPSQAKHAAARVGERMRGAVRELLRAEGVRAEELDAEVGKLMRLIEESAG